MAIIMRKGNVMYISAVNKNFSTPFRANVGNTLIHFYVCLISRTSEVRQRETEWSYSVLLSNAGPCAVVYFVKLFIYKLTKIVCISSVRLLDPKLYQIQSPLRGSRSVAVLVGQLAPLPLVKLVPARFCLNYFVRKTAASILKGNSWQRKQGASVLICKAETFQSIFFLAFVFSLHHHCVSIIYFHFIVHFRPVHSLVIPVDQG